MFYIYLSEVRQNAALSGNGLTHYHTMPHFDAFKIYTIIQSYNTLLQYMYAYVPKQINM